MALVPPGPRGGGLEAARLWGVHEGQEPAPKAQRSRWAIAHDAARLALIVTVVLGAPIVLQVLRRQVSVVAFLVVLGVAACGLAVVVLASRRQR